MLSRSDPFRVRRDLVDDQKGDFRILFQDFEMRFDFAPQFLFESSAFPVDRKYVRDQHPYFLFENFLEKVLFRAEIVMNERLVAARFPGDLGR